MRFSRVTYNIISCLLGLCAFFCMTCILLGITWVRNLLTVSIIVALGCCAGVSFAISRETLHKGANRLAWQLFCLAFTANTISNLYMYLAFISRQIHTPYPCFGDILNVITYIALSVSLAIMAHKMLNSGLPIGKKKHYYILIVLLGIGACILLYFLLQPIFRSHTAPAQIALSSIYVSTCACNIITSLILATISLNFRGRILLSWLHTVFGLILVLVAYVIFAHKQVTTVPALLIKLDDVIFLIGFIMIFRGVAFMRHWGSKRRRSQTPAGSAS